MFRERTDVFVAADLLWYPLEGEPEERAAPDVLVAFDRPKGDRGSYRQWEEDNVPVTVVFEILSPSNGVAEMIEKQVFYAEHGVEEYYIYDPDTNRLQALIRRGAIFRSMRPVNGFISPRLGIRFDLSGPEMVVYRPDGRRFLTPEEFDDALESARHQITQAEQRAIQAEQRSARLIELSRKARHGQASAEELQELDRLEEPPPAPPA